MAFNRKMHVNQKVEEIFFVKDLVVTTIENVHGIFNQYDLVLENKHGIVDAQYLENRESDYKKIKKDKVFRIKGEVQKLGGKLILMIHDLYNNSFSGLQSADLQRVPIGSDEWNKDISGLLGEAKLYLGNNRPIISIAHDYFKHSDYIYISTFNIDEKTIRLLENYFNSKPVTIVTSIPIGKEEEYFRMLHPTKLKSNFKIYINYSNHSKVYVSNYFALIGSVNLSHSFNIESFFITKLQAKAKEMEIEFFSWLIKNSFEFTGKSNLDDFKIANKMNKFKQDFNTFAQNEFELVFYDYDQYGRPKGYSGDISNNELTQVLNDLTNKIDNLLSYLSSLEKTHLIRTARTSIGKLLIKHNIINKINRMRDLTSHVIISNFKELNSDFEQQAQEIHSDDYRNMHRENDREVLNRIAQTALELEEESQDNFYTSLIELEYKLNHLLDDFVADL